MSVRREAITDLIVDLLHWRWHLRTRCVGTYFQAEQFLEQAQFALRYELHEPGAGGLPCACHWLRSAQHVTPPKLENPGAPERASSIRELLTRASGLLFETPVTNPSGGNAA